jgi:hypothetical protein
MEYALVFIIGNNYGIWYNLSIESLKTQKTEARRHIYCGKERLL